jgi:hypothetical protein
MERLVAQGQQVLLEQMELQDRQVRQELLALMELQVQQALPERELRELRASLVLVAHLDSMDRISVM